MLVVVFHLMLIENNNNITTVTGPSKRTLRELEVEYRIYVNKRYCGNSHRLKFIAIKKLTDDDL